MQVSTIRSAVISKTSLQNRILFAKIFCIISAAIFSAVFASNHFFLSLSGLSSFHPNLINYEGLGTIAYFLWNVYSGAHLVLWRQICV